MTYGDFSFSIALGMFSLLPVLGMAQEFDPEAFENAVNDELADYPGVTFSIDERVAANPLMSSAINQAVIDWATETIRTAPDFGFVVYDTEGRVRDIFGGDVPYEELDSGISITGYRLSEDYTLETVGRQQYIDAVTELQTS